MILDVTRRSSFQRTACSAAGFVCGVHDCRRCCSEHGCAQDYLADGGSVLFLVGEGGEGHRVRSLVVLEPFPAGLAQTVRASDSKKLKPPNPEPFREAGIESRRCSDHH